MEADQTEINLKVKTLDDKVYAIQVNPSTSIGQ
jgi:hypothetical protein